MELLARIGPGVFLRVKTGGTHVNMVREGPGCRLASGIDAIPDRTALHEDNRMVTVLACHGRGQAGDKLGLRSPCHELKAAGREMVAFIDNEIPISPDLVVHHAFANQALDQRDIDDPRQFAASAAKPP